MSSKVFDVVQYGALGDGVADDYAAITAAYDALVAAGGGELWFPPGRHYHLRATGVHGLHLVRQSDVTIRMGERAWLVMDNMVDGLAVSHRMARASISTRSASASRDARNATPLETFPESGRARIPTRRSL